MYKETTEITKYVSAIALFDFGRTAYSQLEIELDAPAEILIQVIVGEELKDGWLTFSPNAWRTFHMFKLVLKKGRHTYRLDMPEYYPAYGKEHPFFGNPAECGGEVLPFRYVQICHHYGDVTCRRTAFYGDVYDEESFFMCEDYWMAHLWDFCRQSLKATSIFPCFLDGERERMPYEADAYISMLTFFVCSAHGSIARETIDYFMYNGQYTWPTEYHLFVPFLVRQYLIYTGDTESVARWLPSLHEKLLPHLQNSDGLLVRKPDSIVHDIVDWPDADRDGYDFGTPNFVPNAMLVASARTVGELTGDASFIEYAEKVRHILRTSMLKEGLFVDNPASSHTSLHTAMTALLFGIADAAEKPAHMTLIEKKGMACSVYGAQMLLDTVFSQKRDKHGVSLLSGDGLRSWKNMLRSGSSLTTEAWDDSLKPNQDWNHPWGSAAGNVIARWYCGIRPVTPGFTRFTVRPSPEAKEFKYRHPTPFGHIEVSHTPGTQPKVEICGKSGKTAILTPIEDGIYKLPSSW